MSPEDIANAVAHAKALAEGMERRAGLGPQVPVAKPYASQADMVSAMSDHRYKTDAGYRREVAERVGAMRVGGR